MKSKRRNDRPPVHRARVLVLVVLCAFLVMNGARMPDSAPEPQLEVAPVVVAAPEIFGVEQIRDVLNGWNPSLDDSKVARIADAIIRYSGQYELEPELVTAVVIVESSARPWAYSPSGAVGLMQVMPHMMDPMNLAGNPTTVESNIEAGCWILANNIRRLGEDKGISAYFWGSNIRNLAYLSKVQEARENLRRSQAS